MVKILLIIGLVALVVFGFFPLGQCIYGSIYKLPYYAVYDLYHYIRYKKYNNCPDGFIDFYVGDFGSGKTLSAVNRAISYYDRYNGKDVWINGGFQKAKINILSNVNIARPHIQLKSLQQIVDWCEYQPQHQNEWCICIIDEASAVLNSREFSKNLNAVTINSLVTCRHFHLALMLCSQKQNLCDALLRAVGQKTFECHKYWRFLHHTIFRTCDLENASNPELVQSTGSRWHFTSNKWYDVYDTMATVGGLVKAVKSGDMRTDAEIKESITPIQTGTDINIRLKHKK